MNDRLHEVIAQCAVIHEKNISDGIIFKVKKIEARLEDVDEDIQEHYLKLLMQYYFQQNFLKGLKKLLLQGIRFDMRFEDIKEAFIHIQEDEDNVIEFFEDSVVMLKDVVYDEHLKAMYDYYMAHENYQHYLEDALNIIKRNRYICAHAYKSQADYSQFFLNEDMLTSLKRDLPYLLK